MANIPLKYWTPGSFITSTELNRIREAIKRATPVPGPGITVSQGAGGSVIGLAGGAGGSSAAGAGTDYPFELSLRRSGGHDYVTFRCVNGGATIGGEQAACLNNNPGEEWRIMADEYTVSGSSGTVSNATVDDLEDGDSVDVYAVVCDRDGYRYYLVMPSDVYAEGESAPSDPGFSELLPETDRVVTKVYLGTVKRVGTDASTDEARYAVVNQAVRSALTLGEEVPEGDFPFKLAVEDDGTVLICFPARCCQSSQEGVATHSILSVDTTRNTRRTDTDWYEVEPPTQGSSGTYVTVVANVETNRFYASRKSTLDDSAARLHGFTFTAGVLAEDANHAATGVSQQIFTTALLFTRAVGGGGGTAVAVVDAPSGNAPSIAVASVSNNVVTITNYPTLPDTKVAVGSGNNTTSLDVYLKGGANDYGTNVNTENFEDECLGDSVTPDAAPTPNAAAPACHTHKIHQITADEGDTDDLNALISIFSNVGMFDPLEEVAPTGFEDNDSLLTISDVDDDETRLQPDSDTPSVGVLGDGLALIGHQHPLNVPMATGPTAPPPSPEDYVMPVGVGATGPSGGTASPTTPEFGSQPYYARVDHVHPICDEVWIGEHEGVTGPTGINHFMGSTSGDFGATGETAPPTGVTLNTDTWRPGDKGWKESYCCRVVKVEDGLIHYRYFIFRQRWLSRTGVVVRVGSEYIGFVTKYTGSSFPS